MRFGRPGFAVACFRGSLRFRDFRTGYAALSPVDAGRSPASGTPGTQSISCRSYRSLIGSLKEA